MNEKDRETAALTVARVACAVDRAPPSAAGAYGADRRPTRARSTAHRPAAHGRQRRSRSSSASSPSAKAPSAASTRTSSRRRGAGDDQRGRGDVELAHHRHSKASPARPPVACRSKWSASAAATTRADRIIQEIRKIVEQDGAEVVIGPLSGDEAHRHRQLRQGSSRGHVHQRHRRRAGGRRCRCRLRTSSASTATVRSGTPGWATSCTTRPDGTPPRSSPTTTASAGRRRRASSPTSAPSVATCVQRVFPPLGTTDYSSFIAQLPDPDEVDGYFWVVGGTGTQASLEAFVNAKGDLNGRPARRQPVLQPRPGVGARDRTSPAPTSVASPRLAGDVHTPEIDGVPGQRRCGVGHPRRGARPATSPAPPSTALAFGFVYGYYTAGLALDPGAQRGRRRPVRRPRGAPRGTVDDDAGGAVRQRDARREPPGHHRHVRRSSWSSTRRRESSTRPSSIIPRVDQTFGGTFSADTPPPSRDVPGCEARDLPWVGQRDPVVDGVPQRVAGPRSAATAPSHRGHHRRRMTEATTTAARGCASVTVALRWSARPGRHRPRCRPRRAAGRARPQRGRQDDVVQRRRRRHPAHRRARSRSDGVDCTLLPSRRRPSLGVARTYQTTRLFPGLTVEDNLYLASIGKHGAIDRCGARRSTSSARSKAARRGVERCGSAIASTRVVGDLSHGQQRQLEVGMAWSPSPTLMMLDEPASGLSRGERERLVELLELARSRRDAAADRARHGRRPARRRAGRGDGRRRR